MLLLGGISFCCQIENCKSWLLFLYIYYASGVIFISETPSIILEKHTMAKKMKALKTCVEDINLLHFSQRTKDFT